MLRGVILAIGDGGHLYPLNTVINKHLLPIGKLPMINYAISKLVSSGIHDIAVVLGTHKVGDVISYLGSGKAFGCSFTFFIHDGIGGKVEAFYLTKDFCYHADKIVVITGDHLFEESLIPHVDAFMKQKGSAKILLSCVSDPQRFAVAEFDGSKHLIGLEEYPTFPKSGYAVTGIYMYEPNVFKLIEKLWGTSNAKLSFNHINEEYLKHGELEHTILTGWWTDASTHLAYMRSQLLVVNPPK